MRARSALFTLFGDVVRPTAGEAWLRALTEAMGALGFTPEATRTALHRMAADGWVEPRRQGRYSAYRLTSRGVDRLEEAAARIYRLRAQAWDGRWRLLVTDAAGPERDGGAQRPDEAPPTVTLPTELARSLRWMGFGRLTGDVWLSPHDHGERLPSLLAAHGLADDALPFVSVTDAPGHGHGPSAIDARMVARAWDLAALRDAHAAFLDRWPAEAAQAPADQREAFVTRILLVHHWRSFLFLDPGLPAALLPPDWLGEEAATRFRDLYEALASDAWTWWETVTLGAGPYETRPLTAAGPGASPFTRGLDALSTRRPA